MAEAKAWVMIPKLGKDKTECLLDILPLVLCKDCKHGRIFMNTNGDELVECSNSFISLEKISRIPEFFCADGESK